MRFLIFQDEFWTGFQFLHRYIDADSKEGAAQKLKCKSSDNGRFCYESSGKSINLRFVALEEIKEMGEFDLDRILRDKYFSGDH